MALSDTTFLTIDVEFLKKYLRIDEDFSDDDIELQLYIDAARSLIEDHTEMTSEQLDEIKFSAILLLKYASDFYTERGVKSSIKFANDPTVQMLLDKIRTYNLGSLGGDDE